MAVEIIKLFEHQTNRVKSLSFHPRRPWIVISLHTGLIQLWDYHQGLLLASFNEHEGPIRSVTFHPTLNIFVSGGDDAKIKLWNCQSSSDSTHSIFTLTGHTDYIRSVSFHTESPWILSASDDQTIRIWNWQSRQCLSILTGHTHYVMCALFSPLGDMIASCSLDQTIRIWDISGLCRKSTIATNVVHSSPMQSPTSSYPDLFAASEVIVKHIIEGHDRGINSIAWHPSGQLFLSASDDRLVKVWQLDTFRAWEVDSYSGHFNNVSSAIFAYHGDILISNSEDRTLRVWDTRSKACILNSRRENDRFWFVSAYPGTEMMIFGAAHDSGFVIFKLERDISAISLTPDALFYLSSGAMLNKIPISRSGEKSTVGLLLPDDQQRSSTHSNTLRLGESPQSISVSHDDESILAVYKSECKSYAQLWTDGKRLVSGVKMAALAAIFLTRNRFVILEEDGTSLTLLSSTDKSVSKHIPLSITCDGMFQSYLANSIYLTSSVAEKAYLFDVQQERILSSVSISLFGGDMVEFSSTAQQIVAFGTKNAILILTKKLENILASYTGSSITSLAITENFLGLGISVLFFSTFYTINYLLVTGEHGIVLQVPMPVVLTGVIQNNSLGVISQKGAFYYLHFDPSEIRFKHALDRRDYHTLSSIISSGTLVGQSMVAYLCQKGHPRLALKYVKDPQTRFDLALQCLDLSMALDMALKLDNPGNWEKLALHSMNHGKIGIVEDAYKKLLQVTPSEYSLRLVVLWIITGQFGKLEHFLHTKTGSIPMLVEFIAYSLIRDKETMITMLEESGQSMMAFSFSTILGHRVSKRDEKLDKKQKQVISFLSSVGAKNPLRQWNANPGSDTDWPVQQNSKCDYTQAGSVSKHTDGYEEASHYEDVNAIRHSEGGHCVNYDIDEDASSDAYPLGHADAVGAWGIDDDGDGDGDGGVLEVGSSPSAQNTGITIGVDPLQNSISFTGDRPAIDYIAVGDFEIALKLLKNRYGITEMHVLKEKILAIYASSQCWLSVPSSLAPFSPSDALTEPEDSACMMKISGVTMTAKPVDVIASLYDKALSLTTAGKFSEARGLFIDVLHYVCLYDDETGERVKNRCRNYILGLSIELARRATEDVGRAVGLSTLFTLCDLEPIHLLLTLRSALSLAIKARNYRTGSYFAKRLINENNNAPPTDQLPPAVISQIKKTAAMCDENVKKLGADADQNPALPASNSVQAGAVLKYICASTLEAVWSNLATTVNAEPITCSYCRAAYHSSIGRPFSCRICQLVQLR